MYFGSNEKAYHGSKIHKILKITNQIRNILNIGDVFNKYYVPCFTILIVSSNPKIKIKQKSQNYDFLQLLSSFPMQISYLKTPAKILILEIC